MAPDPSEGGGGSYLEMGPDGGAGDGGGRYGTGTGTGTGHGLAACVTAIAVHGLRAPHTHTLRPIVPCATQQQPKKMVCVRARVPHTARRARQRQPLPALTKP